MTHHWEQQKSTFGYPQNPLKNLNIVGEPMFEWAVISKSIFAQKGNCFENMPLIFSQIPNIDFIYLHCWSQDSQTLKIKIIMHKILIFSQAKSD